MTAVPQRPYVLVLSDEQRSMIASIVVAGGDSDFQHCLCCSDDREAIATEIVGPACALRLIDFAHESLGCGWRGGTWLPGSNEELYAEELYLERISELTELEELISWPVT